MKPKELMKMLRDDGWEVIRIQGSHHIYKHPSKPGTIPVALHNKDMAPGTLNKILKAAGVKVNHPSLGNNPEKGVIQNGLYLPSNFYTRNSCRTRCCLYR